MSSRARLEAMCQVEVALAEAQGALGIIPLQAAAAIRDAVRLEDADVAVIEAGAADTGNLAIPLVRLLTDRVASVDASAAGHLHWGATSQDIIDTGFVVQMRGALPIVLADIARAAAVSARLAEQHVDTVMPGRTWLQQATPITFGLKAAGWLDALMRVGRHVAATRDELLVLQFGGATGTLAALGSRGLAVADALGARLGLRVPAMSWHGHRDRVATLAAALAVAAGAAGKIARDVILLAQTEVAEVSEGGGAEHGGSSTMPHKRNAVRATAAVADAMRVPGLLATVIAAMANEHERGAGGWQAEWHAVPELVLACGGAARSLADSLERLVVDAARMRENVGATRGLGVSEAVAMTLAEHIGRAQAQEVVRRASRAATEQQRPLARALLDEPLVAARFDAAAVARLLTPESYLGETRALVARVLAAYRAGEAGGA